MKLLPVLSLLGCTLALGLSSTPLHAQSKPAPQTQLPPGAKRIPQRNFAVCLLFAPTTPELYFRNAHGDYHQLQIDTISFDTWNIIPAAETLEIFKKTETLEVRATDPVTKKEVVVTPAKTTYTLAKTWTLPPGTTDIRKLYYYSANGQVLEYNFTTATETHGIFQTRIINLLTMPVGVRIDAMKQILSPGADITMGVATAPEVPFIFEYGIETPPFVAPTKKLRFHSPQQRLTIIMGYSPFEEFNEVGRPIGVGYNLDAIRFFEEVDKLPEPPKPVIVYPSGKPAKGT